MITRGLHDSGLHLLGPGEDKFIDAAEDNPEGFWENAAIVACNDDLLEATGGAWDNPPALLPQGADDPRVAHLRASADTAVAGLRTRVPWGFKDPRTCLTAAFWMDVEPDLRFIVCLRHPLEVALSLKRRNQNSYSLGLALWERYYATVLEQVPAERRIVTHYDSFFTDPLGELKRLCGFAGLEPIEPRVRPDLRHHTIDVGLDDAGVTASLRALYEELCREAVVPVPAASSADEGRVRRLILDGAVARRHADQRQQAIERLEERLQEREVQLRGEGAAAETSFRARIRELEVQLADALRGIGEIERLSRETANRVDQAVETLTLSRVRRAVRRITGAASKRARAAAPGPGRKVARRAKLAGLLRARAVARRLPEPAQSALRQGRAVIARRPATPLRGTLPPWDRLPKDWRPAYERLIASAVPDNEGWLVVVTDSPTWVRRKPSRPGAPFPDASTGQASLADLSFVAQLEALRYQRYRRLVVPASSRPWLRDHVQFREHVMGRYPIVADEQGGMVFDLGHRIATANQSLQATMASLVGPAGDPPTLLDWTDLHLGRELPGVTVFRPPGGPRLPYLDDSVAVVAVDDGHDHGEATRVASGCVITVAPARSGAVTVTGVHHKAAVNGAASPKVLVWSADPHGNEAWRTTLTEAVSDAGAELRMAEIDQGGIGDNADFDVLLVVEPYVLPLPGSIETAAAHAVSERTAAVAGKIIRRDGRLEAAGGTVFFDRSVGLIANSSTDVSGPWHEYARPVCWAPGLVAASADLWMAVAGPPHVVGRAFVREWCSEVWASGRRVSYQPTVTAVRLTSEGGEPTVPLQASAWQRVLDLRPQRPRELTDGTWRYLLAHDDVEACRG